MTKLISKLLVLAVLVIGSALPSYADGCKVCSGYYDPEAAIVVLDCISAADGEMGFTGCNVMCGDGFCQCIQEGPPVYCMTIVVEG